MLTTVRIQEKGQVTIPSDIRRKLRLKKGDLVTFVLQDGNIILKSVETAAQDVLDRLDRKLKRSGQSLENLLSACRRMGGEAAANQFGLSAEDKADLFLALQLQAEQALEEIRVKAQMAGVDQLTDSEIAAEIQAARDEASSSHRRRH